MIYSTVSVAKLLNYSLDSAAQSHKVAGLVYPEWIGTACLSVSLAASSARPVEPRPAKL